jgi:hypothetical protein
MSKATDIIKQNLAKYVKAMRSQGREPSMLYVTKAQFDTLRAEAGEGPNYKPRFKGIEVRKE